MTKIEERAKDPSSALSVIGDKSIRGVLIAYAIQSTENQALHGWRCRYPDRYGACTCFDDLVADLEAVASRG